MPNDKLKIINTETDNLISNLRAEVGAIVSTFLLMRNFKVSAASLQTENLLTDLRNENLNSVYVLKEKLEDEIIARLSELAENKIGCINFFFAAKKLGKLRSEVEVFSKRIEKNRFKHKRNREISHKELPQKWEDHRAPIHIAYGDILRAVSHALRLMKRIDREHLGPSAPYLWREMRKRRDGPSFSPPGIEYMLLPHLRLSGEDRIRIVQEEEREGFPVWSEMPTTVNGQPTNVVACRKWGILILEGRPLPLEQYPLAQLGNIQVGPPLGLRPRYEQHRISAQYRCTHASADKLSFEPVQREHPLGDGRTTELLDIGINLSDDIRKSMGVVGVGDVKDLTLNVQVLAGFEEPAAPA